MTRVKVVGLCFVAVFALSAFMVSGAQAVQMGTCVKAAKVNKKYTGKFTNKLCTEKSVTSEGKYEFAAIKSGTKYTGAGGEATLKGEKGDITCASNEAAGENTGGKTSTVTFKFHSCVLSITHGACTSTGAAEGEIESKLLSGTLVGHGEKGPGGKEPAAGEAWVSVTATPYLAEFTCAPGVPFKVEGNVAGKISPVNVQTKAGKNGKKPKYTFTLEFKENLGEQNLTTILFNPITKEAESGKSIQEGSGGTFYTEKKLELVEDV